MPSLAPPPPVPSRVAEHRLSLQGDILRIEVVGNLDLDMMKRLIAVYEACIAHFGYLLLLLDVRHSSGFDADARKYAVQQSKDFASVQATAVYGAPAIVRGFMTLLSRATFLLSKGTAAELRFVSSQDEGRAWLDQQRATLQQAATGRARP
jgi:hypothetical protein